MGKYHSKRQKRAALDATGGAELSNNRVHTRQETFSGRKGEPNQAEKGTTRHKMAKATSQGLQNAQMHARHVIWESSGAL